MLSQRPKLLLISLLTPLLLLAGVSGAEVTGGAESVDDEAQTTETDAPILPVPDRSSERWSIHGFVSLIGFGRGSADPALAGHPDVALHGVEAGTSTFENRAAFNLRGELSANWSFVAQMIHDSNEDSPVVDNKHPEWAFLDYHNDRWQVRFGILPLTYGLLGPTEPDMVYPFLRAPISMYGAGSTLRVTGIEAVTRLSDRASLEAHVGVGDMPDVVTGEEIDADGLGLQFQMERLSLWRGDATFIVGYQHHQIPAGQLTDLKGTEDFYGSLSVYLGRDRLRQIDTEIRFTREDFQGVSQHVRGGYVRADINLTRSERFSLSPQLEIIEREDGADTRDLALALNVQLDWKPLRRVTGGGAVLKIEHHFVEHELVGLTSSEAAPMTAVSVVLPFNHRF